MNIHDFVGKSQANHVLCDHLAGTSCSSSYSHSARVLCVWIGTWRLKQAVQQEIVVACLSFSGLAYRPITTLYRFLPSDTPPNKGTNPAVCVRIIIVGER